MDTIRIRYEGLSGREVKNLGIQDHQKDCKAQQKDRIEKQKISILADYVGKSY